MPRFVAVVSALILVLFIGGAQAETERRIALVIGNGAYEHLPRLANPVSDARLIATTLESVGFKLIGGKAQTDLDRSGFERAIREFGAELAGGAVGLFYYAGHGLQVQGANFLIPVAADPITVADVDFELIDANVVLKQMEAAGSKLNILILDACRNNPFGGRGLRDAGSGLAPMRAPHGTLISYATQPGNTAMDGTSGHSPYTAALAQEIKQPGRQVFEVFNEVAVSVDKATGGRQQPWIAISPLEGTFYFLGPTTVNVNPTPPTPAKPAVPSPDTETVFWQSIAQSTNAADFEEYLRNYPNGQFAGLARNRIASMRAPPKQIPEKNREPTTEPQESSTQLRVGRKSAGPVTISCDEERNLYSKVIQKTNITIINRSASPKRVYWLNYVGERVAREELKQNQSLSHITDTGHPWLVTNTADKCEAIYMPTVDQQLIELRDK